MSKILLAALLLSRFLTGGIVHAQDLDGEAKARLAVAGAAVGRAIRTHDFAALDRLWAPNLVVNGPSNRVLTREQVFEAMRRGQLDYEGSYETTLEKVEFFGDVAVTMGEDSYVPDFGPEQGKRLHRRSTNVWQYANGEWRMIARQATIYDPDVPHY